MDIKVNGKKLILKKVPLKLMKEYFSLISEMENIQDLGDTVEGGMALMDTLEKVQKFLPKVYKLTNEETEEYDMNDTVMAFNAVQILLQEQQQKIQNEMKEYVESFQKN